MDRREFAYDLPTELIAQRPLRERSASRLLVLGAAAGELADRRFTDIVELLHDGDLLVVNDTRVLPARLRGRKSSGGRVEIMIDRLLSPSRARAQIRASRSPVPGSRIELPDGALARVAGRDGTMFDIEFDRDLSEYLQRCGEVPLPPYIARAPEPTDRDRYQTVYGCREGAVAAPTAGLHFDAPLLSRLADRNVGVANVTLHVGAGTFAPVRADRIEDHRLHAEWAEVSEGLCAQVTAARARGARVVAVGTTVVRALETAAGSGELAAFRGDTALFIYPGYRFKVVDALLTNFHLPESSLLMLVAAFAGYDPVMAAYRHAVAQRYRFFSYGDAMFATRAGATR